MKASFKKETSGPRAARADTPALQVCVDPDLGLSEQVKLRSDQSRCVTSGAEEGRLFRQSKLQFAKPLTREW